VAAPAWAFAFAIFLSNIEADVRSSHRLDSPARFKILLRGIDNVIGISWFLAR
jgi:hypothetical protein